MPWVLCATLVCRDWDTSLAAIVASDVSLHSIRCRVLSSLVPARSAISYSTLCTISSQVAREPSTITFRIGSLSCASMATGKRIPTADRLSSKDRVHGCKNSSDRHITYSSLRFGSTFDCIEVEGKWLSAAGSLIVSSRSLRPVSGINENADGCL